MEKTRIVQATSLTCSSLYVSSIGRVLADWKRQKGKRARVWFGLVLSCKNWVKQIVVFCLLTVGEQASLRITSTYAIKASHQEYLKLVFFCFLFLLSTCMCVDIIIINSFLANASTLDNRIIRIIANSFSHSHSVLYDFESSINLGYVMIKIVGINCKPSFDSQWSVWSVKFW